jgi:hypothetical protein
MSSVFLRTMNYTIQVVPHLLIIFSYSLNMLLLCGQNYSKEQSLLKVYGEVNSAYKERHRESSH